MEPTKEYETQDQPELKTNELEQYTKHSPFTKIIIFVVSLALALALGYVLYSQVVNSPQPKIPAPQESEAVSNSEEVNGDPRHELLKQIVEQESQNREVPVSVEQRKEILESLSSASDNAGESKISVEQRKEILESLSSAKEDKSSFQGQ